MAALPPKAPAAKRENGVQRPSTPPAKLAWYWRLLGVGSVSVETWVAPASIPAAVDARLRVTHGHVFDACDDLIADLQLLLDELQGHVDAVVKALPPPVPGKVARYQSAIAEMSRELQEQRAEAFSPAPEGVGLKQKAPMHFWSAAAVEKIVGLVSQKLSFFEANASAVVRQAEHHPGHAQRSSADKICVTLFTFRAVAEDLETLFGQVREVLAAVSSARSSIQELVRKVQHKSAAAHRRSSSNVSSTSSFDDMNESSPAKDKNDQRGPASAVDKAYADLESLLHGLSAMLDMRFRLLQYDGTGS